MRAVLSGNLLLSRTGDRRHGLICCADVQGISCFGSLSSARIHGLALGKGLPGLLIDARPKFVNR